MLHTREEVAGALRVAAEIEHSLLLQYLFAAYSLKKTPAEGITWEQAELCRQWERRILIVAREEMGHLGTVCNLLSAIGEAPHLRRPNFPHPPADRIPFDLELRRFSDEALYRFIRAEQPSGSRSPAPPISRRSPAHRSTAADLDPDPILFHFTGQLYRRIREAFARDRSLLIGPKAAQDRSNWSNNLSIPNVETQQQAIAAIDEIIIEGEGSAGARGHSHYETFRCVRKELEHHPGIRPARPVADNPRIHDSLPGTLPGTRIDHPFTRELASLANAIYEAVLLMLMQYYSFGGETDAQRDALREAIRTSMSMAIRPIAEILTTLPIADSPRETAGPTFEITMDVRLSTQIGNRWTILRERFTSAAALAKSLSRVKEHDVRRLGFVAENIGLIGANLAQAAS